MSPLGPSAFLSCKEFGAYFFQFPSFIEGTLRTGTAEALTKVTLSYWREEPWGWSQTLAGVMAVLFTSYDISGKPPDLSKYSFSQSQNGNNHGIYLSILVRTE